MHYRQKRAQRSLLFRAPGLVVAALAVGTSGGVAAPDFIAAWNDFSVAGWSCDIKGNISVSNGEKIYHLPGQEYYDATSIDRRYGERWFCSEAEAREGGWRRAYR